MPSAGESAGGPGSPRSLPRPRCQAPSGCFQPGGSVGAAHAAPLHPLRVCQPVPAPTGWHQPALTLLFLGRGAGGRGALRVRPCPLPWCLVPGAGQGSEAGAWALPITALPRAGNFAAGPALPQRPGCRGPRGHGAGDPLPTSMSVLGNRPKCLFLPQTCFWLLTRPHPGVRSDGQGGATRGCRARWGWQALGGWQRAKGGWQEV